MPLAARRAVEHGFLDYLRRTHPGYHWTIVKHKQGKEVKHDTDNQGDSSSR